MLKMKHTTLINISGLVWFAIGVYLLYLGLNFLMGSIQAVDNGIERVYPILNQLQQWSGSLEGAIILLVLFSLMLGYFKGRYVLGKSAERGVKRILSLPNPTNIGNIYDGKYYFLLGAMIALGISMKYLGLSLDIRGMIDVWIGSALINGAMCYFRMAQMLKNEFSNKRV